MIRNIPIFFAILLFLCVMESGCVLPDQTFNSTPVPEDRIGAGNPVNLSVNLTPDLTEEQAWEIAQAYFAKRRITGITEPEITKKGLLVYDDAANDIGWPKQGKNYLAWVFYVKHEGKWLMGGFIYIDAHDGHIINVGEIL